MSPPIPLNCPNVPLLDIPPGCCMRISRFEGGCDMRCRLCALGLMPGLSVEVLSSGPGPVLLSVKGSRLAIGRGMAAKIFGCRAENSCPARIQPPSK